MNRAACLVALGLALVAPPWGRAEEPRILRAGTDAELARALGRRQARRHRPARRRHLHGHARREGERHGRAARHDQGRAPPQGGVLPEGPGGADRRLVPPVRGAGLRQPVRRLHLRPGRPARASTSSTARSAGRGRADGKSGGDGLQFFDSSDCLVEKCFIHHCLASRGGERVDSHGIRFTHSRDMTVRGCLIDLVSGDCVQVDPNRKEWDNVLIEDCKLSGGKVAADDPLPAPAVPGRRATRRENAVDTKCPDARAGRGSRSATARCTGSAGRSATPPRSTSRRSARRSSTAAPSTTARSACGCAARPASG